MARFQLRPMKSKRIDQKSVGPKCEGKVITNSFAQPQPRRPAEDGGQVPPCFSKFSRHVYSGYFDSKSKFFSWTPATTSSSNLLNLLYLSGTSETGAASCAVEYLSTFLLGSGF